MHRTRVSVLRGGPSNEYDISLKTGASVIKSLSPEKYNVRDILIDKKGTWHMQGVPVLPHDVISNSDVIFNALHGNYGEDGKLQHILEVHQIPFTGSGSFASAVAMNKNLAKEIYKKEKIKTPDSKLIDSLYELSKKVHEIHQAFPYPMVVKPVTSGSSHGVTVVKNSTELADAIAKAWSHSDTIMVEEYIMGKEATCGVIEDFRGQRHYALPAIEIRPHKGKFFDFEAKYEGKSDEIVPGNFTFEEKKELERLAIAAHNALGMRHYSRSDFIIHPKRGIFILETNSLPGLTEESLIPKSLHAVGATLPHFVEHLIHLAIHRK